jgi:hypothetical protein
VKTLTAFAVPLVGQRVRVVDGTVSRIASRRFFILTGSGPSVPLSPTNTIGVILESGIVELSLGQQIVITGEVRGRLAQREEVGRQLIGALSDDERAALGRRPLLIVSSAKSLSPP